MALTKEAIATVEQLRTQIDAKYAEVLNQAQAVKKQLDSSISYQKYINGTANGKTANEKYNKAISILEGTLQESIKGLSTATKKFLTNQEEINNSTF